MFLQKISLPDGDDQRPPDAGRDTGAQHARAAAYPERPPRVALAQATRMRIGTHVFQLCTIDISAAGAKLDIGGLGPVARQPGIFVPGALAVLTITGLRCPRLGQIRWCRGTHIGFRFDDRIGADELAVITGGML